MTKENPKWKDQSEKVSEIFDFLQQNTPHKNYKAMASFFSCSPAAISGWKNNNDKGINSNIIINAFSKKYPEVFSQSSEIRDNLYNALVKGNHSDFKRDFLDLFIFSSQHELEECWKLLDSISDFSGTENYYKFHDRYWFIEMHQFPEGEGGTAFLRLPMEFKRRKKYWSFTFTTMQNTVDAGGIFTFGGHMFMMFVDHARSRSPRCSILSPPYRFSTSSSNEDAISGHIVATYKKEIYKIYSGQFVLVADLSDRAPTLELESQEYMYEEGDSEEVFFKKMLAASKNGLFDINDSKSLEKNKETLMWASTELSSYMKASSEEAPFDATSKSLSEN